MKGRIADFTLFEGGFEFLGRRYPDSDIRHIFLNRSHTAVKVNLVHSSDIDAARMTVTLMSGDQIVVQEKENSNLFTEIIAHASGDDGLRVYHVCEAAQKLLKRTFEQRLGLYVAELKTKGYFTLDECLFYPHSKVIFRGRDFPVKETAFLRGAGWIEMRPSHFTLLDRLKRENPFTKIPQFSTRTDPDVVFALLQACFGLKWD